MYMPMSAAYNLSRLCSQPIKKPPPRTCSSSSYDDRCPGTAGSTGSQPSARERGERGERDDPPRLLVGGVRGVRPL